jgi:conflict system pore-forming effector with SLATT domain
MFALTVVDHLRLNSDQVAQNYTVHARAAERLARYAFAIRMTMLTIVTAAAGTATAALILTERPVLIASTITSILALAAFAAYLAIGFEARVIAHRTMAHHLWLLCERHRSLLAEIEDGLLDQAAVLLRRDDLIRQAHAVYEHTFAADHVAHEAARTRPLEPAAAASPGR